MKVKIEKFKDINNINTKYVEYDLDFKENLMCNITRIFIDLGKDEMGNFEQLSASINLTDMFEDSFNFDKKFWQIKFNAIIKNYKDDYAKIKKDDDGVFGSHPGMNLWIDDKKLVFVYNNGNDDEIYKEATEGFFDYFPMLRIEKCSKKYLKLIFESISKPKKEELK